MRHCDTDVGDQIKAWYMSIVEMQKYATHFLATLTLQGVTANNESAVVA